MGGQFGCSVPGEIRAQQTTERDSVEFRIGNRNRLDHDRLNSLHRLGGAEQRAPKRQDAVAVTASAFRKQYKGVTRRQSRCYLIALRYGAADPAIDKDGTLELGEPAEKRPTGYFRFGNKRTWDQRSEDGDIGVGDMVRYE